MLEASDETILLYRFRIRLKNGDLLEMMERLVQKNRESHFLATTYSFHWQTGEGQLIKRWDNAPHFPNLPGFPHHIHDGRGDVVKQGKGLSGLEILETLNGEFDKT